jgi:hypothetical protein
LDYWKDRFLKNNLALLVNDPLATASICKVVFHQNGVEAYQSQSTHALKESVSDNLHDFFGNPADASRLYAVHRTERLKRSFPAVGQLHAWDWLVIALALLEGHYLEYPEVLLYREAPEPK